MPKRYERTVNRKVNPAPQAVFKRPKMPCLPRPDARKVTLRPTFELSGLGAPLLDKQSLRRPNI